jgi:hypothetical protein
MLDVHLKLQSEDRAQLIKQLVAVKKHNAALRNSLEEYQGEKTSLEAQLKDTPSSTPLPHRGTAMMPLNQTDKLPRESAETRYGEVLKSLTRMLASERKAELSTLAAIEEHNESITDLERALRKCVDEVASQLESRPNLRSEHIVDSFSVEDREKALEMWLTMDGVLDHLSINRQTSEPQQPTFQRHLLPDVRSPSPRLLPPIL